MNARSSGWFGHTLRHGAWQPQRQVVALGALGFVLAIVFGGLYLSQVVGEATTNRRLETLLNQRDDLERENELLRVEIARLKSVPNLVTRAEALGFEPVEASRIEYLAVPGFVPPRIDTVAPITSVSAANDALYDETFTDWVTRQWEALTGWIQQAVGG